jgi:acid phosphatase family membrane protein YuiD
MYDAAGVRRAAGMHAKIINVLKKSMDELDAKNSHEPKVESELNSLDPKPEKELKEFVGHTPLEVLCGAIVGVGLGLLFVNYVGVL